MGSWESGVREEKRELEGDPRHSAFVIRHLEERRSAEESEECGGEGSRGCGGEEVGRVAAENAEGRKNAGLKGIRGNDEERGEEGAGWARGAVVGESRRANCVAALLAGGVGSAVY